MDEDGDGEGGMGLAWRMMRSGFWSNMVDPEVRRDGMRWMQGVVMKGAKKGGDGSSHN